MHAGDLVIKCNDSSGAAFGRLVCRHWLPVGLDAMVWISPSVGAPVRVKAIHPSEVVAPSTASYEGNGTGRGGVPYPSLSASPRRAFRGMGADGIATVTACASF